MCIINLHQTTERINDMKNSLTQNDLKCGMIAYEVIVDKDTLEVFNV